MATIIALSPRTFNRSIYDIFDRASVGYKKWIDMTLQLYASNNDLFESSMAVNFLQPYVDEFNELWGLIKTQPISLNLAKELDSIFFQMNHMTHLRSDYGYPKIGQVLDNGMVVLDHGLLTMCLCENNSQAIEQTISLRESTRDKKYKSKIKIDII